MIDRIKRAKLTLKGKVQGVFFRDFAKQNANKLGLGGYAKNLKNGSLEVIVEGEDSKVTEFIRICKRGPIFAKVDSCEVIFEEPTREETYFDIRYS